MVPVPGVTDAQRLSFPGSPTVRVDGLDVDPAARGTGVWSLSCRVYLDRGQPRGSPPKTMVSRAIQEAISRQIKL